MNLQTLAREFNVSTATISNALSGKGRVSADLARRIQARAEALGYAPASSGRALRTGRSGVIGLVLPDLSNPLFPRVARAVEQAAAQAGLGVLIADSHGDVGAQTAALRRLLRRGVDGIVIAPRRGTRVRALAVPMALIDAPSTPGNTICSDHREGGRMLAERMLELGHRQLVLIGESPASNVQRERMDGMRAALGGRAGRTELWLDELEAKGRALDPAGLAAQGATAFLATSDLHALRVLSALQRAGLSVPDLVSVAGFDDLAFSAVLTPPLTSMAQDLTSLAQGAIAALTAAMDGAPPPQERVLPMRLIERGSTGPAPHSDEIRSAPPATPVPSSVAPPSNRPSPAAANGNAAAQPEEAASENDAETARAPRQGATRTPDGL